MKRDTFAVPEIQIFEAVQDWTMRNSDAGAEVDKVVDLVRLPLMTISQLLDIVLPSGLVSQDSILKAIRENYYNGALHPEKLRKYLFIHFATL